LNARQPIPIIALTGHGAVDVQAFCGAAGMQGVLSKPLAREQAEKIWQRFCKGENIQVPGLILFEDSCTPLPTTEKTLPVIDMAETVELVGSEADAVELFVLLAHELSANYLPQIEKTVKQKNYTELRKHLHSLIGALCYVKAPRLNLALLELQQAARNTSPIIATAYLYVTAEAKQFLTYYQ
jgi:CheY-like chemotaxis protein